MAMSGVVSLAVREVPLTRGLVALVDEQDFDSVNQHKWSATTGHSGWRAIRCIRVGGKSKMIAMHRQLMGFPVGLVDHINGNTLDNRRCNLRVATDAQNKANMKKPVHGLTSRFKGVRLHRPGKWTAQISFNNRSIYLGIFDDEREAAFAYNQAATRFFGEFARPNAV